MPSNILHRICQDLATDALFAFDAEMRDAVQHTSGRTAPPGVSTVSWSDYVKDITDLRDQLDDEIFLREKDNT